MQAHWAARCCGVVAACMCIALAAGCSGAGRSSDIAPVDQGTPAPGSSEAPVHGRQTEDDGGVVGTWRFLTMLPPPPPLEGKRAAKEYTAQYALSEMNGFSYEFLEGGEVYSNTPKGGRQLEGDWERIPGGAYALHGKSGGAQALFVEGDVLRVPCGDEGALAEMAVLYIRQPLGDSGVVGEYEYAGTEVPEGASEEALALVEEGRAVNEGSKVRFLDNGRMEWMSADSGEYADEARWLGKGDGAYEVRHTGKLCYAEKWTLLSDGTLEQRWSDGDEVLRGVVSRWTTTAGDR